MLTESGKFPQIDNEKLEKIKFYIQNSKSKNTQGSYASDWRQFTEWCELNGRDPLPASAGTICLYLSELATTHKYSTIRRRVSSINMAHKFKYHLPPAKQVEVQALLEGIKREIGTRQEPKKALMLQVLAALINKIFHRPKDNKNNYRSDKEIRKAVTDLAKKCAKKYANFEKRIIAKCQVPGARVIQHYEKIQWLISTDLTHKKGMNNKVPFIKNSGFRIFINHLNHYSK